MWLGLRLLEQDTILSAKRDVERQEAAADAVVRSLTQTLADVDRRLGDGTPPEHAVTLRRRGAVVEVEPRSRVAWVPGASLLPRASDELFADGEKLEFAGDLSAALTAYRARAQSSNPAVRAAALMRTARIHRKRGAIDFALADYRALAQIHTVGLNGMPADLVARRAICDVLRDAGRASEFSIQAAALEQEFTAGNWALDPDARELVAAQLSEWLRRPIGASPEQRALAAAAEWFSHNAASSSGRRVLSFDAVSIAIIWQQRGTNSVGVAVPPATVSSWLSAAAAPYPADAVRLTLLDERGQLAAGIAASNAPRIARRSAADTGLPWTVVLTTGSAWSQGDEFASRRPLLAAGLAALGLLLAGGAYLLWRVVQRELAVATLQAEFVSAVSHEFRTPVTSLRHIIELLQEDDELTRERRRSFYDVLGRSTDRLHRLVESLLDFARMEDGRKPYALEPIDAGGFVRRIARDFGQDAISRGRTIDVTVAPGVQRDVRADADALGHAVWNLLDNAIKYSPDGGVVTLAVEPHDRGVAISVRDEGLGIPRTERGEIFLKFVRGERAHQLGIKGTGVGLAIVSHIMRAHGGAVELESEEGKGSTFRLVLPAA